MEIKFYETEQTTLKIASSVDLGFLGTIDDLPPEIGYISPDGVLNKWNPESRSSWSLTSWDCIIVTFVDGSHAVTSEKALATYLEKAGQAGSESGPMDSGNTDQ